MANLFDENIKFLFTHLFGERYINLLYIWITQIADLINQLAELCLPRNLFTEYSILTSIYLIKDQSMYND